MSKKYKAILFLLFFIFNLIFFSCKNKKTIPPATKREFRGVWIATIGNKDFPSKAGLSTEAQIQEIKNMLDYLKAQGINAVIFQVRPASDALYKSDIEPWSKWITGKQGKAPEPVYDPLQVMIEECHKRQMELHAWFNPYRAVLNVKYAEKDTLAKNHISRLRPHWTVEYDNKLYLNPGLPEVRRYVTGVIMDVVKRYDIDGVHFDDYFYPMTPGEPDFNDVKTYEQYGKNFTDKNAWRRNNVNELILAIHENIQKTKPYIKFGISPSGIWRHRSRDPKGSKTSGGVPAYDDLHADALTWLQEGWIDYIAPQLYWSIGHSKVDYETLANWWSENTFGKHLYIGQASFKTLDNLGDKNWDKWELIEEMVLNRNIPEVQGSIFFSATDFQKNPNFITDSLSKAFFPYPALPPTMPWKDSIAPLSPENAFSAINKNQITISWKAPPKAKDGDLAKYYVIYQIPEKTPIDLSKSEYIFKIQSETSLQISIKDTTHFQYAITAIDRLHNESEAVWVKPDYKQ